MTVMCYILQHGKSFFQMPSYQGWPQMNFEFLPHTNVGSFIQTLLFWSHTYSTCMYIKWVLRKLLFYCSSLCHGLLNWCIFASPRFSYNAVYALTRLFLCIVNKKILLCNNESAYKQHYFVIIIPNSVYLTYHR